MGEFIFADFYKRKLGQSVNWGFNKVGIHCEADEIYTQKGFSWLYFCSLICLNVLFQFKMPLVGFECPNVGLLVKE